MVVMKGGCGFEMHVACELIKTIFMDFLFLMIVVLVVGF